MKSALRLAIKSALMVDGLPMDVDFLAIRGELNFLCGPNGAGKTSLITFFKKRPKGLDEYRLSFLDQGRLSPLGDLTVKDCLKIAQEELGLDPQTYRPDLLSTLEEKKVKDLSGGENQLLKYVMATASKFDLLFIDEPLLNLDSANKEKFISLFKELTVLGKTLVVVEHEPDRYGEISGAINYVIEGEKKREVVHERV